MTRKRFSSLTAWFVLIYVGVSKIYGQVTTAPVNQLFLTNQTDPSPQLLLIVTGLVGGAWVQILPGQTPRTIATLGTDQCDVLPAFQNEFTCAAVGGTVILIFTWPITSEAGTYASTAISGAGNSVESAYVIIVEPDTKCPDAASSVVLGAVDFTATITCTLVYGGEWPFNLTWTQNDDLTFTSINPNVYTPGKVEYEIEVGPFTMDDLGTTDSFTCTSSLMPMPPGLPDGGGTLATNVPGYSESSCDVTFDLQFGVRDNITITMSDDSAIPSYPDYLEFGDKLTCVAVGDPEPTYEWTTNITSTPVPGDTFTINETLSGEFVEITCTATNILTNIEGSPPISASSAVSVLIETLPTTTTLTTTTVTETTTTEEPTTTTSPDGTPTTKEPTTKTEPPTGPLNTGTTKPGTTTTPATTGTPGEPFPTWAYVLIPVVATILLIILGIFIKRCTKKTDGSKEANIDVEIHFYNPDNELGEDTW